MSDILLLAAIVMLVLLFLKVPRIFGSIGRLYGVFCTEPACERSSVCTADDYRN